jgi:hypothetical protein
VVEGFTPLSRADLERIRSVDVVRRRTTVREGRDPDTGERYRATLDDAGNVVTERAGDRLDVEIRPATIRAGVATSGATPQGRPPAGGERRIDPETHSAAPCRRCGEPRGDHVGGACP